MKTSFVIPHKGRLEMLKSTIQSIQKLNYDQSQIEIIVVSQNDHLSPLDLISKNEHEQLEVILTDPTGTISTSRNIGAKLAQGNYLAFLDADIELSTNWLSVMIDELKSDNKRKIISAIQANSRDNSEIEKIRTVMNNFNSNSNVESLAGANLFISKKDYMKVGGFPEHLATCEDIFFTSEVAKIGTLFCTSKATHIHLGEDKKWSQLFTKEIWRGQSNLKSLKGRDIPIREYPSLLVPLWFFFFSMLSIVSIIGATTINLPISLLGLLLPVFLYTVRLKKVAQKEVSLFEIFKFYLVYFSGRSLGSVIGIVKAFNVRNAA